MAIILLSAAATAFLHIQAPLPTRSGIVLGRRVAVHASADDPFFSRRAALFVPGSIAVATSMPDLVSAESTLVTRQQAYTRYVPRVERGRDYWATGLRKAVQAGDWATISQALEKKGSIDRIFGPMELWASSWSSKTIADKTIAMNSAVDELREAAAGLKIAAAGKESSSGFFGFLGGGKTLDPAKRSELAVISYKKGVAAINKYILIGNDGLGLSFAPLDTID